MTCAVPAALFDNGANYGSRRRLRGINRYPIPDYFDMAEQSALHEMGHQWINFLAVPGLQGVRPHWPISSLAYGIMGYNSRSNPQGLTLQFQIVAAGNQYRFRKASAAMNYTDMDLYLMGLAPAESVKPHLVVVDQAQQPCDGCPTGPVVPVTVDDVIAAHGPRVPAYGEAQTHFRVATVIVSSRLLTPREMAFFDYFAARGEATKPLPYTSGFARGTALPFALATGHRGTLSTTLGAP